MSKSNFITASVLLPICLFLTSVAPAKIIHVDDDATGAKDGSSWANAFTYLQKALAIAERGDEIRVAQGRYRPDQGTPPMSSPRRSPSHGPVDPLGSPYAAFQLKNAVAIKGGFAGIVADDPDARDAEQHATILSGDLNGNDPDVLWPRNPLYEFLRMDNSIHVVESTGTDSTAVLDGFVIESAVDSGLLNLEGSPRIVNCLFRECSAQNYGGGAFCSEGGQPSLSNCVFQANSTEFRGGGAIVVSGAYLTLVDCRFVGNWALMEGGAICGVDSDLALTGCTFEMNSARMGGAIHQTGGTLTLVECVFEDNAANEGGAVALAVETASMARCVFERNWAIDSGGAVECAVPMVFDECIFSGNSAGYGGAINASRLSSPQAGAEITTMTHCILTGNRAFDLGGALCCDRAEFAITSCTFAGNWARTGSTLGWLTGSSQDQPYQVNMHNCIVWDGEQSISTTPRPPRRGGIGSRGPDMTIEYSDVQSGWPGEGNIDADPCFAAAGYWVDAANPDIPAEPDDPNPAWVNGDYHLKSQTGRWDPNSESWVLDDVTSSCIDTGDPNSPVGDEPEPNGARINMGAYGGTAEASMSFDAGP